MKNYQEFVDTVGLKDLQSCVGSTDGLVVCCFFYASNGVNCCCFYNSKWGICLLNCSPKMGRLCCDTKPCWLFGAADFYSAYLWNLGIDDPLLRGLVGLGD